MRNLVETECEVAPLHRAPLAVSTPVGGDHLTRAALIVLGETWPQWRVAGLDWPEYRVRLAMLVGARHIVVLAARITPAVLMAVDRATALGATASVVRSGGEVGDLFHPDESVLLMSGNAAVAPAALRAFAEAEGAAILCVDPAADEQFELIDATARWSGIARIDGGLVRATSAEAGEWSLASMLLRKAVARRASRTLGDALELVVTQADASRVTRSLVSDAPKDAGGWATRCAAVPPARVLGRVLSTRLDAIATIAPWTTIALSLSAIAASVTAPFALAAMLAVLAVVGCQLGTIASSASLRGSDRSRLTGPVVKGAAAIALVAAAIVAGREAGIVLSVVIVSLFALDMRLPPAIERPAWSTDLPGAAIVIGVASLWGSAGFVIGTALAAVHALVTLAWRQNRLSATLTSTA
jgi:hypothetical protein